MTIARFFADIAIGLSAALGGPFHAAQVIDQAGGGYTEGGSTRAGYPLFRDCRAQVDIVTDGMRGDGVADGTAQVLILAASLDGDLDGDARLRLLAGPHRGDWLLSAVTRDPAGAYWQGSARRG